MRRQLHAALLGSVALTGLSTMPAFADTPTVATDISSLGGLVSAVMGDLGTPEVIVPATVSPHDFAMRPSQARALDNADLVVWMGEGLMPVFGRTLDALSGDAHIIDVSRIDGTLILGPRENALVEVEDHHDHGDEDHDDHADHDEDHAEHEEHDHEDHDHDDDHDHEDHDDHDHADDDHAEHDDHDHEEHEHAEHDDDHDHDEEDHDDHAEGHTDHSGHDHDHSGADPHSWLYPENAKLWLTVIAEELSELDPENAATYAANAETAASAIDAAVSEAKTLLADSHDKGFVTFHDAYRYYETAFEIKSFGSIASGHAAPPSPSDLADLRDIVASEGVTCIFAEPQFNPRLVETVAEGTDLATAVLDPHGADLEMGPDFYPALIVDLAKSISSCGDQ